MGIVGVILKFLIALFVLVLVTGLGVIWWVAFQAPTVPTLEGVALLSGFYVVMLYGCLWYLFLKKRPLWSYL